MPAGEFFGKKIRFELLDMDNVPAISVIIPVYNTEKYIGKCLESVISSAFSDLEIICVDDGSDDGSPEILRSYSLRDPRIRIFTQEHLYAGAARNTGIKAAAGKYIHFLDSDDEILPEAYEKLYETAEKNQAEVCECLYINTDSATGAVISKPGFKSYNKHEPLSVASGWKNTVSLIMGHVIPWNKLYLREFLINNALFFDDLICAEDRSFYYNVIFHTERIVRITDRLIIHRLNIGTSLDGSGIRFRHFDVEFRSFKNIMDIARNESKYMKNLLVQVCIVDSLHFYSHSVGTEYEHAIRNQMCDFWWPYLFRVENESVVKRMEKLYSDAEKESTAGLFRRVHLLLYRSCLRGYRYLRKLSAAGRRFAYRSLKK